MIKKLKVMLLLIVAFGILLTGCSKKDAEKAKTAESTAATQGRSDKPALKKDNTKGTSGKAFKILRFGLAQESDDLTGIMGLAEDKGYLADELAKVGYKIKVLGFAQAGPAVNEAFVAKNIDVASYGDLPSVVLKSKGIDVSVVGIAAAQGDMSLVVPKNSSIKSVKDLEGKKVIVCIGTVYEQYWDSIVKEYDLDEDKIQIINDPANAQSTFISGSADALIYTDIYVQKVNGKYPVRVINSTKRDHPDWAYQGVVVARNEYAKVHPEVLTALFKAYIRAYDDAAANRNVFLQSFVSDGITLDLATKVYGDSDIKLFDGDIAKENIDKLENLNRFLFDNKLTKASVDINRFVDTSYYEAAKAALKK